MNFKESLGVLLVVSLLVVVSLSIGKFPVQTAQVEAPIEIAYDDGKAEEGWDGAAGRGFAVRFTPPVDRVKLLQARYYIWGFYKNPTPIEIHVWDADHKDLIEPFEVTPTEPGWFEVDLSPYSIVVTGDFYIGYLQTTADAWPWMGSDTTEPDGRTYYLPKFVRNPFGDVMIRAVVVEVEEEIPEREEIFYENFETDLSSWYDIERQDRMYISDQQAYAGSRSLEMRFEPADDEVAAGWMRRRFFPENYPWPGEGPNLETAGVDTVYLRVFERWSENWQWPLPGYGPHNIYIGAGDFDSPTESELTVYLEIRDWQPLAMTVGGHRDLDYTDYPATTGPTVQLRRWHCLEIRVTMSEPGQSNGIIQVWLDEELVIDVDDAFMRREYLDLDGNPLSFHLMMIGPWYHDGVYSSEPMYIWMDELAVSRSRIGCQAEGVAPPTEAEPGPPEALPDLVAWEDLLTDPADPKVDQPITFTLGVLNQGEGEASQVEVLLRYSGPDDGESPIIVLGSVEPGQSNKGQVTLTFTKPGSYLFEVVADPQDLIEESDEDNNIGYFYIEVGA